MTCGSGRLCRVCGTSNSVLYRLADKPGMLSRLSNVLGLKLDTQADRDAGFPDVVCRKCCNLVDTFHHFKQVGL